MTSSPTPPLAHLSLSVWAGWPGAPALAEHHWSAVLIHSLAAFSLDAWVESWVVCGSEAACRWGSCVTRLGLSFGVKPSLLVLSAKVITFEEKILYLPLCFTPFYILRV